MLIKSTTSWWHAVKLNIPEFFPFFLHLDNQKKCNLGELGMIWISAATLSLEQMNHYSAVLMQRMLLLARTDCDEDSQESKKKKNRTEQLLNCTTQPPARAAELHLPQHVAANELMRHTAAAAASYLMLINSSQCIS